MLSVRSTTLVKVVSVSSRRPARPSTLTARADGNKVVREYREDDDKVISGDATEKKALYADPNAQDGVFKRDAMSKAQQKRLREEYLGWGGSAEKPMSNNYFLWIIVFISVLAVLSYSLGYI